MAVTAADEREIARQELIDFIARHAGSLGIDSIIDDLAEVSGIHFTTLYRWKRGQPPTKSLISVLRMAMEELAERYKID